MIAHSKAVEVPCKQGTQAQSCPRSGRGASIMAQCGSGTIFSSTMKAGVKSGALKTSKFEEKMTTSILVPFTPHENPYLAKKLSEQCQTPYVIFHCRSICTPVPSVPCGPVCNGNSAVKRVNLIFGQPQLWWTTYTLLESIRRTVGFMPTIFHSPSSLP